MRIMETNTIQSQFNPVKFFEVKSENEYAGFEGYAVRFTDFTEKDLDKQYFDKTTFFGYATKVPLFYDHAFNRDVGKIPIGYAELTYTDSGVEAKGFISDKTVKDFFSDELEKAKYYLEYIKELGLKGALGFSSGAVGHTVRYTDTGHIKQWILGELSLTPTPADPKNYPTIKVGREFSDKNRERLKKLHEKISELKTEIDEITKDFESAENPSVLDTTNKHTFIQYLGQKNNGKK